MRVAVFPSDDGGCGWYRLRWPAGILEQRGEDVHIAPRLDGTFRPVDARTDELTHVEVDADVLVFQRIVRAETLAVIAQAKEQGLRVVVDVDDDLDALHENHPYLLEVDGQQEGKHRRFLHDACQLADVVTVTTPALAERYGYGKAVVLPNLVPDEALRVKARRKGPSRVGWTGRPQSHINDALVMDGKVGPVVADAGARFAAWGQTAPITFRQVNVPTAATVTVPYRPLRSGYYGSVAELSVGLAPLQDSTFNRGKSWLKAIEYSALGVPFVASPLPEYRKLHDLGAGLLAESPQEWAYHVRRLLADPRERADLAEAGGAAVANLTYSQHAHRWLDAWQGITQADDASGKVLLTAGGPHPPAAVANL